MCHLVLAPKEGPAFVLQHKMSLSPVTYCQYQAFICKVVSRVGLAPRSFFSDSFRHGRATWAVWSYVLRELIKVHGDWKSNVYLKYLEFSLDQRLVVVQTMAE